MPVRRNGPGAAFQIDSVGWQMTGLWRVVFFLLLLLSCEMPLCNLNVWLTIDWLFTLQLFQQSSYFIFDDLHSIFVDIGGFVGFVAAAASVVFPVIGTIIAKLIKIIKQCN